MDTLSELLDGVAIRGSVFCHGEVRAPWCMSGGARDLALFHAVVAGTALARHEGREYLLEEGDLMVLPRGRSHVVGSDGHLQPVPLAQSVQRDGDFARIVSDGDGAATRLICGTFQVPELDSHPLLAEMPDVVVVRGRELAWLGETLIQLDAQLEQRWLGAKAVTNRLVEILFVQAVAAWLRTSEVADGRVAAFADENLSRALAAIHAHPDEPWSVDALAREAAMSRSSFYRRFNEVLGETPAAYLKQWRMTLAKRWLLEGRGVSEIGPSLGYSGAPAFSRAFKDHVGINPSEFR